MNIPYAGEPALARAISDAHALVDMGVPVFVCGLDEAGNPVRLPRGWEKTEPDHSLVDKWRKGMGMCAVTGRVFDVLDIDPRNGGAFSRKRMVADLGENAPDYHWEVRTPGGGAHYWIMKLGIGTRPGFLPGLDLKGGKPDGSSRGFVYIPPTVRPSSDPGSAGERRRYVSACELESPNGEVSAALREYIEQASAPGVSSGGREEPDALRAACLGAEAGSQRAALLRYVHELERRGYMPGDIIRLCVSLRMPAFDKKRPWKEADFRSLLHPAGVVVADAAPGEVSGRIEPLSRPSGLRPMLAVENMVTTWLWFRYLAVGDITILDADPGTGKSLITLDVAARFSRGWAMPGEDEAICEAGNVLLLAPEDRASVIRARLDAAGADLSKVFIPDLEVVGRGRARKATWHGDILTFPSKINVFARWVADYAIGLVVIDPVAAFLDESINSHNDASVRRALEPMGVVLGEAGCSGLLLRHLNKDVSKDIRYRGSGSVAFGAVSRIQLFAAELPSDVGVAATHGVATVKNNHLEKRPEEVLTYAICDSVIPADALGSMVPILKWYGNIKISVGRLAGGSGRHGPEASTQSEVEEILEQLFATTDTVRQSEIKRNLAGHNIVMGNSAVRKAKQKLGLDSVELHEEGPDGKIGYWVWTREKARVRAQVREERAARRKRGWQTEV